MTKLTVWVPTGSGGYSATLALVDKTRALVFPWSSEDRIITLEILSLADFRKRYRPGEESMLAHTLSVLQRRVKDLGVTPEAADELAKFIKIPQKDMTIMAKPAAKTKTAPKAKGPVKGDKPETKAAAKETKAKAETKAAAKEPKAKAEKKPSVSSRICELIMEGKKTDDQIFETVAKEFGLDEKKRSYIQWNRNNLRKQGKNPPEPVGGAKPKAEAKPAAAKAETKAKPAAKGGPGLKKKAA